MTPSTLIAVCCYAGDAHQVQDQMVSHTRSGLPVVILSPEDSPVIIPNHLCYHVGKRSYIGAESLDRQLRYFEILLSYPHEFFLLHDSDSMMLSKGVPEKVYQEAAKGAIWSGEIAESRPHPSPYPKLAFQPPYFLSRESMRKMLDVSGRVPPHPVTPYIDWFMNALSAEAGLAHFSWESLEHGPAPVGLKGQWELFDYHIRHKGAAFVHPIKTPAQRELCMRAREFYES